MRILLAAAALALLASPSFAQSADDTLTISGTMTNVCSLSASPTASGVVNGVGFSGGDTVSITPLFNTTNATMTGGAIVLTYQGMCNYAHSLSLRSQKTGLSNASSVTNAPVAGSNEFVTEIGYDAAAAWGGQTASLVFNNETGTLPPADAQTVSPNVSIAGANGGNLVLTLLFESSGTTPVLAGAYSDTLFIQIGADI